MSVRGYSRMTRRTLVDAGNDTLDHGRIIARYDAPTGRLIDQVRVTRPDELIAATRSGRFVFGETDDGYSMFRVTWPVK
jgi:hypothetical protein